MESQHFQLSFHFNIYPQTHSIFKFISTFQKGSSILNIIRITQTYFSIQKKILKNLMNNE